MTSFTVALLVSLGFGVAAAILPLFNNEAYLVAALAGGHAHPVAVVLGLGVGNGVGKTVVFLLVRAGKRLPWWRPLEARPPADPTTPQRTSRTWWARLRSFVRSLLVHISDPRWGAPLVVLSAATSVPPIYPVTLLAGTTTMRTVWFATAATVGSLLRMAALVLLTTGAISLL